MNTVIYRPNGSYKWLFFWTIYFFPVAIAYYLMRDWSLSASDRFTNSLNRNPLVKLGKYLFAKIS